MLKGASAGIGAATAVAYAKQGAKLVLGGRNEENLKKTAKLCEEQGVQNENVSKSLILNVKIGLWCNMSIHSL